MKEYEYGSEKLTTIYEVHDRINTIINDVDQMCTALSRLEYDSAQEFSDDVSTQMGNAFELLVIAKDMAGRMEEAIAYRNELLYHMDFVKCDKCGWKPVFWNIGHQECSGCGKFVKREKLFNNNLRWIIDEENENSKSVPD